MASVVNSSTITGPAAAVFDLVTTARFWPQWHPASRAVGGVIERPYQLGDLVYERGEVAGIPFRIAWKVDEHIRPLRTVLRAETPSVRIIYTLQDQAGTIHFRREVEYDEAAFRAVMPDPGALRGLLHAQSEEAVHRLKELVERILRQEAMGLPA